MDNRGQLARRNRATIVGKLAFSFPHLGFPQDPQDWPARFVFAPVAFGYV